jgi:cytochrome c
MDSFEFTKIAGAVLTALLVIFGTKTLIESRQGHSDAKPGYTLPGSEPAKEAKAPADAKTAEAKTPDAAKPADAKAADAKPADAKPAEAKPAEAATAPAGGGEVVALLAKASADNGKAIFGKCKACHNVEKGKPAMVGPNLWGVVDRPKGSFEGFKYSAGMTAKGGNWTFADLATFISKPSAYVAGTKMVFAGLPNAADAADVIAYLAAQADTPVALPK